MKMCYITLECHMDTIHPNPDSVRPQHVVHKGSVHKDSRGAQTARQDDRKRIREGTSH